MSMRRHVRGKGFSRLFLSISIIVVALFLAGKLFLNAIYVPVILMYHSIDKEVASLDGKDSKLNVLPRTFTKQMKFLYEHDYKIIPLAEFIERIKNGKKIPRKTIAITFDDGLKNNFLHAYPALKRYNFPATIFVVTDFIEKKGFLTARDMETMQKENITIGSHTISHRWLPALNARDAKRELFGSKKILEGITGQKIKVLSYPLGGFNEKIKEMAKEADYMGAVATNPGRRQSKNDIYALKRIRISMTSDNLLTFWIETSGYYTFIKEIRDED